MPLHHYNRAGKEEVVKLCKEAELMVNYMTKLISWVGRIKYFKVYKVKVAMFSTKYFHYIYLQSPYLKFSSPYSFDMTSIFLYRSILCWKWEMFDLSHCVLYWFYEKWQNSWSCFCAWSKDLTIVSKQQECVFILYLIVSLPMQQCYNMFSNKQKWLLLIVFIGHKNVIYSLTFVVGRKFRRVYDGRNIDCHASLVFMSIRYNKPPKNE